MIREIATSLRTNLEQVADAYYIVDRSQLTGKEKPFITVEFLFDTRTKLSAGGRSKDVEYTFQVGVFADSGEELLDLQKEVDDVLSNPAGITLYTKTGIPTDTKFECDVSAFTSIKNSDTHSDTNDHRGYFDVSVRILTTYGDDKFTQ